MGRSCFSEIVDGDIPTRTWISNAYEEEAEESKAGEDVYEVVVRMQNIVKCVRRPEDDRGERLLLLHCLFTHMARYDYALRPMYALKKSYIHCARVSIIVP